MDTTVCPRNSAWVTLFSTSGVTNHDGDSTLSTPRKTSTGICITAVSRTEIHLDTGISFNAVISLTTNGCLKGMNAPRSSISEGT